MAIKLRVPRKALFMRFLLSSWGRAFLLTFVLVVTGGLACSPITIEKYARITEEKLAPGRFPAVLCSTPRRSR